MASAGKPNERAQNKVKTSLVHIAVFKMLTAALHHDPEIQSFNRKLLGGLLLLILIRTLPGGVPSWSSPLPTPCSSIPAFCGRHALFCLTSIPSSHKSSLIFIWHQRWGQDVGHGVAGGCQGPSRGGGRPELRAHRRASRADRERASECQWHGLASAFCPAFELSSYVHQINPLYCVSPCELCFWCFWAKGIVTDAGTESWV